MSELVKVNEETISSDYFIRFLKYHEDFEDLMDKLLADRVTVHAARKQGLSVSDEELQERIDQFRRVKGLHRAKETMDYIESLGFTVDEFGEFIRDELIKQKMLDQIYSDEAVNEYFKLNSPQFDALELRHILVESEGKARELVAILEDCPEDFEEMAREHSLSSDTAKSGGDLGRVMRGVLAPDIEAKVFNAAIGEVAGPFESDDELLYEIFRIDAKYDAELNSTTTETIKTILHRNWLKTQLDEHNIDFS